VFVFLFLVKQPKNQSETYCFLIFLKLDSFWDGGKNISKQHFHHLESAALLMNTYAQENSMVVRSGATAAKYENYHM